MLDLTCPNFQIFIGSSDISLHVTGYSFRHPLAEISTPLIWTGQLELDLTVNTSLGLGFFDDEINPSRWLSGLQPIDVYFNSTYWQRFRIKPSGYRYDQITGQAVIELTDIIGILDSYQPAADAPDFKTGADNRWNDLAVKLINKQAQLMGRSVSVETPPYGIGGIYKVPRTVSGSYIKEAQKMAGERGYWMWCDKEVIKWVQYPESNPTSYVWSKSRKELLNFDRQQGLDPVKESIAVSGTHEDINVCQDVYPKRIIVYASSAVATNTSGTQLGQKYQTIASITTLDRLITGNYIYKYTKKTIGNPMLTLFGGTLDLTGKMLGEPPEVKGYKTEKPNQVGGFAFLYNYTKNGATFLWDWTQLRDLLDETDVSTYENVPVDSQNASKLISRVVIRSEPWAKFPDGLQYFGVSNWFSVNVNNPRFITERITTIYKYIEIFRDDIIVAQGQRLYEIASVEESKEQVYFEKKKIPASISGGAAYTEVKPRLVPSSKSKTVYRKICQGRWNEVKETWQNKGQSPTSQGYLFAVDKTEQEVLAIPEIIYRPAPYPVFQKPLLGVATVGAPGVSPFVQNRDFKQASTLTTKAECEALARYFTRINWQRYYSRELASGFGTVLNYVPFQGVLAGNGAYIRDRFGVSLNREGDEWQFIEDCIGNKTGTIPEILTPALPFPPILSATLTIGVVPNQDYIQNAAISLQFAASGGIGAYVFSSTALPTGLSITGNVLSGSPSAIGTTSVTVTVTDSLLNTASTTFNIVVSAVPVPISIVSETIVSEQYMSLDITGSFLDGIVIPLTSILEINVDVKGFFGGNSNEIDLEINSFFSSIVSENFSTLDISNVFAYSNLEIDQEIRGYFGASLESSTLAFWTMDELADPRVDLVGALEFNNPFSEIVGYSTGKLGNAIRKTTNLNDYRLDCVTSSSSFDITVSLLAFSVWVKVDDLSDGFFTVVDWNGQYYLEIASDGTVALVVDGGGFYSSSYLFTAGSFIPILVEIDVASDFVTIQVDGNPVETITGIGSLTIGAPFNFFTILGTGVNIDIDMLGFYDSLFSPTFRATLNSGTLNYPF